jgi:dolichol-phosphate mannosyltransferase
MNQDKITQFLSVVLYIYNNEKTIGSFLSSLSSFLYDNFGTFEIICVNDKSNDFSVSLIHDFAKTMVEDNRISIINMSHHQDVEAAMNAGVDLAIGDFIVEFDSVEINLEKTWILEAYQKAISGFDIVTIVPKTTRDFSPIHFNNLNSERLISVTPDLLRIVSRRALNRIKSLNLYIPFRKTAYAKSGLSSAEIVHEGKTASKKIKFQLFLDVLIHFTRFFERVLSYICFAWFFIVIFIGLYLIISHIYPYLKLKNNTILIILTSFGFLTMAFIFMVVVRYMTIILNILFQKKHYTIESIEKL